MHTAPAFTAALGHIASRKQLLSLGLNGTDLTRAVRAGDLWRVRQAMYATRQAPGDALSAVRVGGKLCGISAARSYGLWSGLDERVHIALAPNASRLRTNLPPSLTEKLTSDRSDKRVVLHWVSTSKSRECWRVSLEDCLRQVVAWTDAETGVACLDTAVRKYRLALPRLVEVFSAQSLGSQLIASRARNGSDSGVESIVRQRLGGIGIAVRQQVHIAGVGRVDMVAEGTRVVIEVDSTGYHSDPQAFENDRRRDAELVKCRYIPLRLSYERVMNRWSWCEEMVLAAISASTIQEIVGRK